MLTMNEKRKRHQDTYERIQAMDRQAKADRENPGKAPFVVAGTSVALRSTARALVVRIEATRSTGQRELLIPYSAIHDDSEVYHVSEGREGKLVVHEWLGVKEGLPRAEK